MISNHGGRQLDGVQAGIDALEEMVVKVQEMNPEIEIYMDGGVRTGMSSAKRTTIFHVRLRSGTFENIG